MADTQPLAPTDAELIALIRERRLTVTDGQSAYEPWQDLRPGLTNFARDVLAKWGAQPVPAGYALVPVEPTPEMLSEIWVHKNGSLSEAYRAMLAAAPQPVVREPLTDECLAKRAKVGPIHTERGDNVVLKPAAYRSQLEARFARGWREAETFYGITKP